MVNEPSPASMTVAQLRAALDRAHPDQIVLFVLGREDIDHVVASAELISISFNVKIPSDTGAHSSTFTLRPLATQR